MTIRRFSALLLPGFDWIVFSRSFASSERSAALSLSLSRCTTFIVREMFGNDRIHFLLQRFWAIGIEQQMDGVGLKMIALTGLQHRAVNFHHFIVKLVQFADQYVEVL